MADTSWGFRLPSLGPSIAEAVQMGEQKRQRDYVLQEREKQQQQEEDYKRLSMIDKASNAKDFMTDNAKVDAMVNQRLSEIRSKYSSGEYAKLPANILYAQLQQELAPLMTGATAFKGTLAQQKEAIAKMAKVNPNLDVEGLTADVRDILTTSALQTGPDGGLNFLPPENWKWREKNVPLSGADVVGQLVAERGYDLSSAPFIDRLSKEKSVSSPLMVKMPGGDYVTGKQMATRFHGADVQPDQYGAYSRMPQFSIRGDNYNGRKIATQDDLREFEEQGTPAEISGFRRFWSDNKARYERDMPKASDGERKRAALYDVMSQYLKADIDAGGISRKPGSTTNNFNSGSKDSPPFYKKTAETVDMLLNKAKAHSGSVPFKELPAEAQDVFRDNVRGRKSYEETRDDNIALQFDEDGIPWLAVYVEDADASGKGIVGRWKNLVRYDREWLNVEANKPFGQKAKIEAAQSGGGETPSPPKPGEGAFY